MKVARRIRNLKPYLFVEINKKIAEKKAKGEEIISFAIGDPDIPTPRPVIDAFHSFNDEVLSYGPAQGFLELRQAIAAYFGHYNIPLVADNIIITCGGSEAIHFAFSAVADPGDEIIIPEPFYTNYNGYASFASIKIVPLTLRVEDGYRLPGREKIEAKISRRTKAILLCSPNNPMGTVYTAEELERVAAIVRDHDLFLIGDEVYKEFVYDGAAHKSVLELDDIQERVIVVDSISKRYSCCGARIGTVITRNPDLFQAILRFAQARLCPPTVEQRAALAAYRMGLDYFKPVRQEYERRRDVLYEGLLSIPGVVAYKPQGAFYITVKLPIKDSDHFVVWMLSEFNLEGETVMVAPAAGFYSTPGKGLDEVRIAYVLEVEKIKRAIKILRAGLEKYQKLFS